MTDRLNPEAFLAAKDAAQEAFQANKDWHDITTAMLSAYDKSIAAAWPRTITTAEELEALPHGVIVLDADGDALMLSPDGEGGADWVRFYDPGWYDANAVDLPARVLWVPTERRRGMNTILVLLNEHRQHHGIRDGRTRCACGWKSAPRVMGSTPHGAPRVMGPASYGAHLAGVLEAHQQEREAKAKAEALEEAASDSQMGPVAHGWNASGIASWLRTRAEQIRETS